MQTPSAARLDPRDDHVGDLRALMLASQRFRQAMADHFGLSLREVVVLGHLADGAGEVTPRDLAERMLLGSGTLTAIIDRLADGGYVRREPNPRDRRSSLIMLTAAGKRVVRHVNQRLAIAMTAARDSEAAGRTDSYLARLATALDDQSDRR